jgi:excisionase family DNA binding protein
MKIPLDSPWKASQQHAAIMLAAGLTITEAANNVHVHKRTIYNWLCNGEFKLYVDKLRAAMLGEALRVLTRAATQSARTMVELLEDTESSIRLRAAQAILDTIGKLREHIEFDRRIAALEDGHELEIEAGEIGDDEGDAA